LSYVLAGHNDLATVGVIECRQQIQKRGLAGA
jgi:hypothetical protein